jgi:hypothetical protein
MLDSAHGCIARVFSILTLSSIFWSLMIPLAASAERGPTSNEPKSAPAVDRPAPTPTTNPPGPAILSRDAWRATMARTPIQRTGALQLPIRMRIGRKFRARPRHSVHTSQLADQLRRRWATASIFRP